MIYWQSLRANPSAYAPWKPLTYASGSVEADFALFIRTNPISLEHSEWTTSKPSAGARGFLSQQGACTLPSSWLIMHEESGKTYHFEMKIWTNLGIHTERVLRRNSISNTRQQIRAFGSRINPNDFHHFSSGFFPFLDLSVNINSDSHLYSHFLRSTIWFSFSPPFPSCLKNVSVLFNTRLGSVTEWRRVTMTTGENGYVAKWQLKMTAATFCVVILKQKSIFWSHCDL